MPSANDNNNINLMGCLLHEVARAAITKYYRLKKQHFSQFCRLEAKNPGVINVFGFSRGLSSWKMAAFSLCSHIVFAPWAHLSVSTDLLLLRTPVRLDQGPP